MNARRWLAISIFFTLSLALALPLPRIVMSRQVTHLGEHRASTISANTSSASSAGRGTLLGLAQAQPTPSTILRTLVYHEITASPIGVEISGSQPRLSKNGNRALFIVTPTENNPRLRIINFDGSGERELDATVQPLAASLGLPDISADGTRIVYPANFRARPSNGSGFTIVDVGANAGGDKKRVFAYNADGGSTGRARISGDGSKVFYCGGNGFRNLPDGTQLPFGVLAFNANDGSYLREVVSLEAMYQRFGLTSASVDFPGAPLNMLSVSHDGSRIAFVAIINGNQVAFSVNADGSGLVSLLGPTLAEASQKFIDLSISGDGSKVAYNMTKLDSSDEIGVVASDGNQSTRKVLLSVPFNGSSPLPTGLPKLGQDMIDLNTDGSKLMLGSTGVLADTVTNDLNVRFLQLATSAGIPIPLIDDGMFNATMSSSATRFLYSSRDAHGARQIVTLEINPPGRGSSPEITEPKTNPTFLLTNARSQMTLSARVSLSANTTIRANSASGRFLRAGLQDAGAFSVAGLKPPTLLDDGTDGDPVSGDGVYTRTGFITLSQAVAGPRIVRINAEVQAADSKRHATAIDFEPFTVTAEAPLIDLSQTSLEFGDVTVGQNRDLQLTVRNIGNASLTINSFAFDNSRFSVVSPAAPFTISAGGQQSITVRFNPNAAGQQRGTLTINSSDQTRPAVTVALAGNGTTSPTCTFTIAPTSQNFAASGGTGSVSITASQSNCNWTATSNAGFIAITSSASGTGNGVVNFSVTANTGAARNGTMTIAGQTFTVTQSAGSPSCTYIISPTSQSFAASGGQGSVSVTTQAGCAWTGTSEANFIVINSGTPGSGNGSVNYTVGANTGTASRSGTMIIAGQTFTVNQSGTAGPIIRIEPTTINFNVSRPASASSLTPTLASLPSAVPSSSAQSTSVRRPEIDEEEAGIRREFWEWFYQQRQSPANEIPIGARQRAVAEKMEMGRQMVLRDAQALATQWTPIGPTMTTTEYFGNVSGRVTSIIIHPTNPNIVYVGAAQGGVWKTVNNGANWMNLTDSQPSLAMGALAFDPINPNIIYAGTGEQNYGGDNYYGNGVLKSTDGGTTWSVLGAAVFARQTIGKIVVQQNNTQIILVAASNGLFRTTNGGGSWTRVLPSSNSEVTDIVATPGTPNTLYASVLFDGIYKSTDGGTVWTKLTNGLPTSGIFRAQLSISTANPATLIAIFSTDLAREYSLEGIYRTTDAGASWAKTAVTPSDIFGTQGFYNIAIALHPTNPNLIYFGGIDVGRSTDGGATWTNLTRGYSGGSVHPDQHAIAFNPQNPAVVWIGNDGGVLRSDNGGDNWVNLNNGLSTMQFQSVGLHPTDDNITYGGTQDNGTQQYTGNGTWRQIYGGDGGTTIVDFSNPTTGYFSYIRLRIGKFFNSGSSLQYPAINGIPTNEKSEVTDRTGFYSPFAMDPTNSQRLAGGTYRVYYTTNGAENWTNISPDLTGGKVISALTFASSGSRIWTGSSDNQVWRGDLANGSWSWTNLTKAPLPGNYVTDLAAHPTDPQIVYVSYSGFGNAHIFKTTDGGNTWTNASSGVPDIPVNTLVVDPNNPNSVYAGTDIGVYRSTDSGQSWLIFGSDLPNVAVFDLAINKASGVLRAATHGRGLWEIQTGNDQSFTIFNDGSSSLQITGISKQNNSPWLSFTTPSSIPFEIAPGASAPVRVSVNAGSLNAGSYSDRLLVTSSDAVRSPYPNGVFVNLTVFGSGACTFSISPVSQTFPANGGTGSINVTAPAGCPWTASSNADWIMITSNDSGNGNGTVSFSVAANTSASSRTGTATIAGKTFTVTQSGSSTCTFTVSPTSLSIPAGGGPGSITVTTQSGCNWTAKSNLDWFSITSGASGAGSGTVNYSVAVNPNAASRTGNVTIAGQNVSVTQAGGSSCSFTIAPTSQSFTASGGTGSVAVTTQSNCNWTAISQADWITFTLGASGAGSGLVNFLVAANTSKVARTGTLIIAGQTFTVRQAASSGACTVTPISIGQTVNGALTTSDCRSPLGGNFYADRYSFTASAGQPVTVLLTSSNFDAYLILIGPDGEVFEEDDDGGGGTNARIPFESGFLTLTMSGTYLIEVSSSATNETGNYTLSLIAPSGCTYSIAPTSQSFTANGGTGSVAVTAQAGCPWTASSNVNWISISSGSSGQGNGTVNFSVAANTGASSRTGTLTVAGSTFTVTQAGGSSCSFTITPTSQSFGASGGAGSVNVTTQSGCNWTATSNANWISITSSASGVGNGVVNYSVAANTSISRTGTLTIAGQTFTVTQAANSNCVFTLSPASQNFPASGGNGTINVTTTNGCTWTASSGATWITFPIGTGSGSGSGTVSYTVAANTDANARSATINIADKTFTVTQAGVSSACPTVSSFNPTSGTVGTTVIITGTNLTGVTAVKFFNNVAAVNVSANSTGTQLTVTVPSGATTGPITVSKTGCADVQTASFMVNTAGNCVPVSISNTLSGGAGSSVTVPIIVGDLTGKGVTAFDFTLMFDPAVVHLQAAPVDKTGTLSNGFNITTNTSATNKLTVSGFGTTPLSGAGTLLNLKFDLVGATSACSSLALTSFVFNEGTPCVTISNGQLCIGGGAISGTVNYGTASTPKQVPGVTISAAGTPAATSTTNNAGAYNLTGLGGGPYTVTPSKTGDVNGISSFDASQVAQHVTNLITLTANQQIAGDASGNGSLSSFDASLIAQTVAGIANSGIAGTWKFVPANRSYPSLSGSQTNQNFDAILVGDVTGNWTPSASGSARAAADSVAAIEAPRSERAVAVSFTDHPLKLGSYIKLPVRVGDLTGLGVTAYDFDLLYDPRVLRLQASAIDATESLSQAMSIITNTDTPGCLRVAAFGTEALAGSGTLLWLSFEVIGEPQSSRPFLWRHFQFNEGETIRVWLESR